MKLPYYILSFAIFLLVGCNSEDTINHEYTLNGKWKQVAYGNNNSPELSLSADGHTIEFLPDGTFLQYNYESSFRIDSGYIYLDGVTEPDIHILYRYTFINKKRLRLDHVEGHYPTWILRPTINIYERMK